MPKSETKQDEILSEEGKFKLKASVFMVAMTGMSFAGGFGAALAMAKKKDPDSFNKSIIGTRDQPIGGGSLAARALGRATVYAVGGFSIFCFAIWKLIGAKNMEEFREKIGTVVPKAPRNPSGGRTEFKNLTEIFQYVIDEDKKSKDDTLTSTGTTENASET
ncbi:unnamed protein product [Owenia fusiformis]|uniref:Transmembrane protein 242 n=1 Tax=Owenia fusiformis TaxID=6347 RepID=A0A8J1UJ27_OWEFU|nr:unnamed protein product [Owenia fusiformis]